MGILLNFKSPKEMSNVSSATIIETRQWKYAGVDGSILELDTDTWVISCDANSQSAKIDKWEVDEGSFSMKLKSDNVQGDFVALDYVFSVAMIGQLVSPVQLVSYLKSLDTVFKMHSQDAKGNADEEFSEAESETDVSDGDSSGVPDNSDDVADGDISGVPDDSDDTPDWLGGDNSGNSDDSGDAPDWLEGGDFRDSDSDDDIPDLFKD